MWTILPFRPTCLGREQYLHQRQDNMHKKSKKRIHVLRDKLAKFRPQIAGAKQQNDDPEELQALMSQRGRLEVDFSSPASQEPKD